jgi:hypothetical protein
MKCTIDELYKAIQELKKEELILDKKDINKSIENIMNKIDNFKRLDRIKKIDKILNL